MQRIPPPWRPLLRAIGIATLVGQAAVALLVACGSSTTTVDPCPGDDVHTAGEYCDQIVRPMCDYAVNTCMSGDFDTCVSQASATCAQGNAKGAACTADAGAIAACVYKYAGADAAFDGTPPPGTGSGLSCDAVQAGYAPPECQSIVQLK